ncbi:DUF5995 family protein [Streptomyces sp. CB01881]|uniref:DUF5995 family protein n=1 Tax=Streptomyces sp. CB01881 TaxID=2078691 RepID=UPI003211DB66
MARGTARAVDEVIRRLREIDAGLPDGDGVAVFNRMYLTVTAAVHRRLAGPYFADPAAMAELDAVFAGRYLLAVDAVAAGRRPPACWRPLFELRGHSGVHPLQFALAGMNAHIQHDLPLAVIDTCRRLGRSPEDLCADYHRINGLLAAVETAVREQLMPGPDVLERAEPLTHRVGAWSVDSARDAAWASVAALWELREVPHAAAALAAALDVAVGLLGRALLTPLGFHGADGTHDTREGHDAHHGHQARQTHEAHDTRSTLDAHGGTAGRLPGARNRLAVR